MRGEMIHNEKREERGYSMRGEKTHYERREDS